MLLAALEREGAGWGGGNVGPARMMDEWFEKVKRWGRGVRVGCGARLSLVKIQMHH